MDAFILTLIVLLPTGIFIGFTSGFLGVGGGFLMVPVQFWLLTSMGVDPTLALRIAFGTSLAVVVPTALSGAWGHHCRKCVLVRPLLIMIIPCIVGAVAGAAISTHAPGKLMESLFGILLLFGAARMLMSAALPAAHDRWVSKRALVLWGLVFGTVSGLFGVGGGIVMVPIMVTVMRLSVHEAIGTSTALMISSSIGGVVTYIVSGMGVPGLPAYSLGYVDTFQWIILAAASIPMAQAGVKAAHYLHGDRMRMVFVSLAGAIGIYMFFSGLN